MPSGLTFGSNCTISGSPVVAGTQSFTVTATDSSTTAITGSAKLSLVVNPPPLSLSGATLDPGAVAIQYYARLLPVGGISPYTCTLASGSVPAGLAVGAGCALSGVPTAATSAEQFTVQVTDSSSPAQTATAQYSVTIDQTPSLRVEAGNMPVSGATLNLYSAGTDGNGSAPTLLGTTTTGSDGGFAMPSYTCPSADAIVYLVASGGVTGSSTGINDGTALMTTVGACSNLATTSHLVVNEMSTIASVYAFAQFLKTGGLVGATATNLSGLTLAAGSALNLVDEATGATPGSAFPSTATAPLALLNLLADLMNDCITAESPTGAACSEFFSDTAVGGLAPTNTLDAVMNLAQNPSLATAALYTLAAGGNQAYTPLPATAPADWTLYVTYKGGGMNDPTQLSIDSKGRVWVANYFAVTSLFENTGVPVFSSGLTGASLENSYGGAVDASDNFWVANEEGGPSGLGTITVFNSEGQTLANSPYTSGGLDFPTSISHSRTGTAWVVDFGNSHLSLLDNSGNALSGSAGYTSTQFVFPVAVAVDSKNVGWVVNQSSNTVTSVSADGSSFTSYVVGSGPSGVAVDEWDNIWTANFFGDSVGLVSSSGHVLSGAGYTGGGIKHPQGIAVDGAGTAWVTNYRNSGISALSSANSSTPGALLSPAAGLGSGAALLEAFSLGIDAAGNIWVSNFGSNTLTEFVGLAVPVKTPLLGPVQLP